MNKQAIRDGLIEGRWLAIMHNDMYRERMIDKALASLSKDQEPEQEKGDEGDRSKTSAGPMLQVLAEDGSGLSANVPVAREIKFRVWMPPGTFAKHGVMCDADGGWIHIAQDGRLMQCTESSGYGDGWDIAGSVDEANPKYVLMQYTGLKDRNGREIYEGDILREGEINGIRVVWVEDIASFGLTRKGWMYAHYFGEGVTSANCEVVGNVHENPELLTAPFQDQQQP